MSYELGLAAIVISLTVLAGAYLAAHWIIRHVPHWLEAAHAKAWVDRKIYRLLEQDCDLLRELNKFLEARVNYERALRIAEHNRHMQTVFELRREYPKAVPRTIALGEVLTFERKH